MLLNLSHVLICTVVYASGHICFSYAMICISSIKQMQVVYVITITMESECAKCHIDWAITMIYISALLYLSTIK